VKVIHIVFFQRWPSGLRRSPEKRVEVKASRGFHSSTGAQLLQSNALSDSLHPILDYMAHERGGFNILWRFRLTILKSLIVPSR
jgi:hypothetical protein